MFIESFVSALEDVQFRIVEEGITMRVRVTIVATHEAIPEKEKRAKIIIRLVNCEIIVNTRIEGHTRKG